MVHTADGAAACGKGDSRTQQGAPVRLEGRRADPWGEGLGGWGLAGTGAPSRGWFLEPRLLAQMLSPPGTSPRTHASYTSNPRATIKVSGRKSKAGAGQGQRACPRALPGLLLAAP